MKYSRKSIDKAGRVIISSPTEIFDYIDAVVKVDDRRKQHLSVIDIVIQRFSYEESLDN